MPPIYFRVFRLIRTRTSGSQSFFVDTVASEGVDTLQKFQDLLFFIASDGDADLPVEQPLDIPFDLLSISSIDLTSSNERFPGLGKSSTHSTCKPPIHLRRSPDDDDDDDENLNRPSDQPPVSSVAVPKGPASFTRSQTRKKSDNSSNNTSTSIGMGSSALTFA